VQQGSNAGVSPEAASSKRTAAGAAQDTSDAHDQFVQAHAQQQQQQQQPMNCQSLAVPALVVSAVMTTACRRLLRARPQATAVDQARQTRPLHINTAVM
jgi:hypothetical protein